MSERRDEPPAEERDPSAAQPGPVAAEDRPPEQPAFAPAAGARRSLAALWLAVLLVVVLAGVASSPFWAGAVAPLLPWGRAPAGSTTAKYDALSARVTSLEQRPAPPTVDVDAIKSAQAATDSRVTALEGVVGWLRQNQQQTAGTKTALAQLAQRIDQVETQASARAAAETADVQKIQQELAQRTTASDDLSDRLAALQHQVQAQQSTDRTGSVLLLALLQMREAVEEARPFPAEYAAFKQLAASDPELAAAAGPLAEAAQQGMASRAVLRQGLTDLAAKIPAKEVRATKTRWWWQALDRLRGLVTVRHIGGENAGPVAAVNTAEEDLAQGDLAAAVAEIDKLTGANADAAQPWLRMARQRLSAETALTHLQGLLTTRLGAAAATPAATTAPTPAPGAAPTPAPNTVPASPASRNPS